jgi:hypothetical protein
MMKPSNNNSPGGNQTETDEDTDEELQDDVRPNGSSYSRSAINVDLQQKLTDERKKRFRAERATAGLKTKLETSEAARVRLKATREASNKKLRGDISVLKLKESAAVTAASNSSRILGHASKEAISSKSKCIRDLRKQILEQVKVISTVKALQAKIDRLQAEVQGLNVEKSLWTKEKKNISKSNQSLEKKLDMQMTAKFAHQLKMAEIALDGKRLGLEQTKQRQINLEDRQKTVLEGKKELARFSFKKRDESKIADQQRKEDAKSKKAKTHADRLQVVSSEMLRNTRLNGGSFPSPGLNIGEAYAQLQHAANAPTPAAMPPSWAGPPLRQMTMTQAYADDTTHPPTTNENQDPNPVVLPPGWQAYRGDDEKVVYFHKATGKFEGSLDDLLLKKKKPELTTGRWRSAPSAHSIITPDAARKTPPRSSTDTDDSAPRTGSTPRTESPRPDAANSRSSIIITSPIRKITITRVPGVVDLLTSGSSENENEESDDDEETDLEFQAKTCDLPLTADFTRRTWDSGSDSDDKSQSLL